MKLQPIILLHYHAGGAAPSDCGALCLRVSQWRTFVAGAHTGAELPVTRGVHHKYREVIDTALSSGVKPRMARQQLQSCNLWTSQPPSWGTPQKDPSSAAGEGRFI
jgi:hypothetical protein